MSREEAGRRRMAYLLPTLAGIVLILVGIASLVMVMDGHVVSARMWWTIGLALGVGAVSFTGILWFARGHTFAGGGLSASAILAAAGLAGLLRHSAVLVQVVVLMFITGFFSAATVLNVVRLVSNRKPRVDDGSHLGSHS